MDVNYKLDLTTKDFNQIKSLAHSMGIHYAGEAGGNSNPHHKFVHPNHPSRWIFVIDSAWRKDRHVRFQKFYTEALQASGFKPRQEDDSGRNVSIPYDVDDFGVALASCCDSGPSAQERETQQRIVKNWAGLFGEQYDLKHQWKKISAGVPDLIASFLPTHSLVVIELKVVHTGREVLTQLERYLTDPQILGESGDQAPLGAVIAPSYQESLLTNRCGARLYLLFVNPIRVELIHDGWKHR